MLFSAGDFPADLELAMRLMTHAPPAEPALVEELVGAPTGPDRREHDFFQRVVMIRPYSWTR
ncbi:hypothetical protein GCM10009550_04780 [Actinocorallia libanotica]|uniref:Uncharacterized protein n=1 Tax=Actinocorallia libanotica TaxID=46162 RepID=A0ABP4APL9_9ACTN